jgi:hypothetical protein
MNLVRRAALLAAAGAAAMIVAAGAYFDPPEARAALGGPVILGGDDLTSHGCANDLGEGAYENNTGWLYMQRALENIKPNVTRANDGSVAALGSSAVEGISCGDAGSAIAHAAGKVGLTVTYYDTAAEINSFFDSLAAGTADPAVIWIAGDDASNDLCCDPADAQALTDNAQAISDFVSQGGGLMSHGTEYGWLFVLLPDATAVDSGGSGDLFFTPEGLTDLPALTVNDINAGPWHNHFEGDFGGLQVLVRSSGQGEGEGGGGEPNAAVILGGAQVTFEPQPEEEDEPDATATPCIPPLVTYRCDGTSGGGGGSNPAPTSTPAAAEPTPVVSVAPATVVPSQPAVAPVGIAAPDTGDGTATAGASGLPIAYMVLLALASISAGIGIIRIGSHRKLR